MAPRTPDHVKKAIIDDYVRNPVAYLTLASRHGVTTQTVGRVLHAAGVVDKSRNTRSREYRLGVTKPENQRWSKYELMVLRLLAKGVPYATIAEEMKRKGARAEYRRSLATGLPLGNPTTSTIRHDIAAIARRLGARNVASAIDAAHRKGILGSPCVQCGHQPEEAKLDE